MPALTLTPTTIARNWLSDLAEALDERNGNSVASLFLQNGWLRDSLVFTWDSRSLEGPAKIAAYLSPVLQSVQIGNVELTENDRLAPSFFPLSSDVNGVEFAFTFDAPLMHGRGFARLLPDHTNEAIWKALSVYVELNDVKGYEENDHELGLYGGHTIPWEEVWAARVAEVERDPQVVIVGAGQCGLQVAARFKQMNIRTIVIERNAHVGDHWRKRYPTLTLHTPRTHHTLLYASYPSNWPTFTPRDKVAAWLDQYAEAQDLFIWTSSEILSTPTYDDCTRKWTITVNKAGVEATLQPRHIVLATGTLGAPRIPTIPNSDAFRGTTLHASAYAGAQPFAGKRVLVVGAGNTGADVCQDLHARGAVDVTMLQRSATCVISAASIAREFAETWPEGVPVPVSDFKAASMPLGLLKKITIAMQPEVEAFDKEMREGLEKGGLRLMTGPDGSGQKILVFERLGGYWIDVGLAELISDGLVKVKSGVEIAHFTEIGVVFTDGTQLDVDAVIFATGYQNIRPTMSKLFGAEAIGRTREVWGLDEEGELKGCYRPSGHPGLWYAAGDFFNARYMSKQLALLIKAEELGLTKKPSVVR